MIPIRTFLFVLASLCVGFTGCTSDTFRIPQLPRAERSLGDISKFFAAVASANEVFVYEGLPHPTFEHELYVRELKRRDVIWFEGYPFYATPLPTGEAERKSLTAIATRQDGHVPFGLAKFCGGFHPDYAIIWKTGNKKSGSLVCFGCHEWKNFTPAGRLYEDLGQTAYEELRALLAHRVVHRPKEKKS